MARFMLRYLLKGGSEMQRSRLFRVPFAALLGAMIVLPAQLSAREQQDLVWKLKVSAAQASVRLGASEASRVVATLSKGTVLDSYEAQGVWFRVTVPPGKEGIVLIGYVARVDVEILEEKAQKPTDFWGKEEGAYEGIGFRLKLFGGWAFYQSGDIDPGEKGLFDIWTNTVAARGVEFEQRTVSPLHSGFNLGGDVIYDLGPKLGVGLGFVYTHTIHADSYTYNELKAYENSLESSMDLTVFTFKFSAYYTIALGRRIKIELNAGPALFYANLDYTLSDNGREFWDKMNLTGKAWKAGVQGGLGVQIGLSERVAFFVDVQGRYAKISNLAGSGFVSSGENGRPAQSAATTTGSLYFVPGAPSPRLTIFADGSPDAAGARKAVFDFTGADVVGGIIIRF
jgi:hypothetical protein